MTFANVNDIILHYKWIDTGREKTLVFINSLGTDFIIWDEVVERLEEHGNILLFDKRGHGLSDVATSENGLEDYTGDLWQLLLHLEIEKCIPVGLSVGGIIAQLLTYRHPEVVEKLVLCDTRHKIGFPELWNNRIQQIKEQGLKSISEDLMKRWFAPPFHQSSPAVVQGCRNMVERCDPAGYVQTCEGIRDADTTEAAKRIRQKTLCIVGSEDKSTTPEEVKALADLIEGSRFETIEGSGHIPCVDNPERLSKLIIDFINEEA
ncbi:MAG: 3-oxoadipate enol-lactonase [Bacteroidota bacterium]|nr:3-oxoadipate enol-lactonase [Flavisolibacter sp.]MDQ3845095.1 3-oxoadipate enol-lactonase [Bacteroidota bacterium]